MSKHISRIPLERVERIGIWSNSGPVSKWLTLEEAMVAQAVEPDIGINGGYYNGDGTPAAHLKADGVILAAERDSGDWGYAWDAGPDIKMVTVPPGGGTPWRNHITCKPLLTPWDGIDAPLTVGPALQGRRGWQAVGLDGKHLVIRSSSDGADGIPLTQLRAEMYGLGCETAMALDSGQSVMYRTRGGGVYLYDSRRPKVQHYIFIWLRPDGKEDEPMNYRVTADVGLNIRREPGKNAAKVGGYGYGEVVSVLEVRDGWARTSRGWVSMAYLEPVADRVTDGGVVVTEMLVAKGRKNRPGRANPCKYITVHETGNKARTADAGAHGAYLRGDAAEAGRVSWHYTVDDHAIVQHLPDGETAYHAGDGAAGPGNAASIGIEICVNEGGDFTRAKANAAGLVRLLLAEHGIPLDHVVQHHHWSGKDCPQTIRATAGGWEAFVAACGGKEATEPTEPTPEPETPDEPWYAEARAWVREMGIADGTRPLEGVTRAEDWTMMYRLYNIVMQAIKAGK